MISNKTKTYIAGDWTGDKDLIDKLYEWNKNHNLLLHFVDAHELTQSRDTSLYCSIKKSLSTRLDASKTFVLVVGEKTDILTKGGCQNCSNYRVYSYGPKCLSGGHIDYRSYIEYECEKAKRDGLKIVVIYNFSVVKKSKCPAVLRDVGKHVVGYYLGSDGKYYWNYQAIKDAIMS